MIRNPNPTRIQDNNESLSTTRNANLTRIQDVAKYYNTIRIWDVIRNPYPIRIEDPFTCNGIPITWARAMKMKEALHVLIQAIWVQSIKLNQYDPFGAYRVNSGLKLIHLVQIEDLGPNNIIGSNLDTISPKE